jgi:[ribosomal protein S5]-alanine N-acetyltransferase
MKPPATIETPRLRLRTPVMDDAEAIFTTYARDSEATRYVSFRTHRSADEARDYLRRCAAGWAGGGPFTWVIALREEGRLAGAIDIRPEGHRVELGYILGRAYWGRGYMTEVVCAVADWALAQPEVHRVWAVCDVDNLASARVLEKAGMEREGRLRRWGVHPNLSATPRDYWCYARVKGAS